MFKYKFNIFTFMKQFQRLLKEILVNGEVQYEPRTEEYILGIPGWQERYDLREGFPLLTTKNMNPRLPFEELFWKLRGERSVKSLFDRNVHIWDANAFDKYLGANNLKDKFPKHTKEWADEFEAWKERLAKGEEDGDLGPVYGFQWRHWPTRKGEEIDQLDKILRSIKEQPGSRYHLLNSYNVGDRSDMALGPCPFWHQFTVYGDQLDLHMVQRSCDTFLGVPFNIAQDALLTHMVAQETDLQPRRFIHTTINTHLYLGVPPRADFWTNPDKVIEFQKKIGEVTQRSDYHEIRDWYIRQTSEEGELDFGKDHIPDALTQLAKRPRERGTLMIKDVPFYESIERPVEDVVGVEGYNPHRWKTNSVMAA